MTELTITLAANRLAPSSIVGQAALYDTLAVTVTGVPWDTGHSYIAYLAKDATYMGGTSVVTVTFSLGIATWTFDLAFTHSALVAAFSAGAPLPVQLRLWDATAGQHVCAAPLTVQYAPEPDGWVQSDPAETAATAGQIATAVAAHTSDATDAHDASAISVAATPTNYTAAAAEVESHLAGINTKLGTVVARATADGEALADANRLEVGQYIGAVWVYCVKTGTQLKAWLKSYFDGLYATAAQGTLAANAIPKATLTQDGGIIVGTGAGTYQEETGATARASIGAYRAQTVAASGNAGGAVTLAFATDLILQLVLTSNWTSSNEPTGLADGETAAAFVTLGGFTIYAAPADTATAKYGPWTVTGLIVRVTVQRVGSVYYWTAVSF